MTRSRWELIRDNWWYEPRLSPVLALSEQFKQAFDEALSKMALSAWMGQSSPQLGWPEPRYEEVPAHYRIDSLGLPVMWGDMQVSRLGQP